MGSTNLGTQSSASPISGSAIANNSISATELNTALQQSLAPVGSLMMFAGSSAPSGWLFCNGSAISRTTYSGLFAVLGVEFGAGDTTTTFNIPDFRGRVPIGVGTGSGLTARYLSDSAGNETVQLQTAELPSHNHTITDPGHYHSVSGASSGGVGATSLLRSANAADGTYPVGTGVATTGITQTNNRGSNQPHNNMQPYLVVNYIIKY